MANKPAVRNFPFITFHVKWTKGTTFSLDVLKNHFANLIMADTASALTQVFGLSQPEVLSGIEAAMMGGYSTPKSIFLFFKGTSTTSEIHIQGFSTVSDLP